MTKGTMIIAAALTAAMLAPNATSQSQAGSTAPGAELEEQSATGGTDAGQVLPPLQEAVMPGQALTKCGVTITNHADSTGAVFAGPLGGGCFEDINVQEGRNATIHVDADADGLEYLQVTVRGVASLRVQGDAPLGIYDPRDLEGSRAGILVEGAGNISHPGIDRANIVLSSDGNVLESLSSSHDHQINVFSSGNLIRLRGEDAVKVAAPDNMILSLKPTFFQ